MKRNSFIMLLCFSLSGLKIYGQISTNELPVSFSFEKGLKLSGDKTIKSLPAFDMEKVQQEDKEMDARGDPPRFGYKYKVDYSLDNSGTWTILPNGDKIWQLAIHCHNALSINLLYDKFWLPEGAKFFIYSDDKKQSIGAFTSKNNKGNKKELQGFATGLIYGDRVTLEYYLPRSVEENGIISIAYVVHGYRYIYFDGNAGVRTSGDCQVNVNCSEGQNWQNEKNAVALILVNGNALCSGSLINTTANDARPLLLTASHCLKCAYDALGDSILNDWSFYWNYESPNCTPTTYPTPKSTSGAVVVSNNGASDFALFRLTEDPKTDSNITTYYLGWDRTGNPGTGGVGIHHPNGDVKKISTYDITPATSNCMNFGYCMSDLPNSNFWNVNWIATINGYSVMESGSSGSPLINSSHRIIGQLSGRGICNEIRCEDPGNQVIAYGKFSVSWNNSANIKRRLSNWLDPLNTGATTMNGSSGVNCVNDYTNQTVTSNTTVIGCNNLNVQNITVQNNAKLKLDASGEVIINGPFEVALGSELEIK